MIVYALYAAMFIAGLVVVIGGKIKVSQTKVVTGLPARVIGLVLMAAVPITMVITIGAAAFMVASGTAPEALGNSLAFNLLPLGCLIAIAFGAAIAISKAARRASPTRREAVRLCAARRSATSIGPARRPF